LPEKIEIFWKFAWKNRILLNPDPRPPRFQTRLTAGFVRSHKGYITYYYSFEAVSVKFQ